MSLAALHAHAYTPGPWTAKPAQTIHVDGRREDVPATVRRYYVDDQGRRCTAFICECNSVLLEQDANATLIAAAPDLLAACKNALDWSGLDGDGVSDPTLTQLRAVIAKAEGR